MAGGVLVGPEWTHKPDADSWLLEYVGPRVLVTEFEDGAQSIREKWPMDKRVFRGTYTKPNADARRMIEFFRMRRYGIAFSIYSFDPEAKDPDTDIALVRFIEPRGRPRWISAKLVRIAWAFREV